MKLGIFSYLAWAVVNMVNHIPDDSNYIDAWLVFKAEDLYGYYRARAEFAKRSREFRQKLKAV